MVEIMGLVVLSWIDTVVIEDGSGSFDKVFVMFVSVNFTVLADILPLTGTASPDGVLILVPTFLGISIIFG